MYMIITASPNEKGLTAACGEAALRGIHAAGRQAEIVSLNAEGIRGCLCCGDGWGTCREGHTCVIDDGFERLMARVLDSEGVFLVTPVYWSEPSEHMKYFLDRARRCRALDAESPLHGKQIALVAAAGGSGNGTVNCLGAMELWCRHVGAVPFERVSVSRFNRESVLSVIEQVAVRMGKGK
jgi:multimeric flavodoxin WrbA